MSRIGFFLQEAVRALRRSAAPSIAAIVTIVVTVLLLGVLVPVLQTTQGKTEEVRDQLLIKVFGYPESTDAEVRALRDRVAKMPHVERVGFVSKAEALKILKQRLDDASITQELPSGNPLPPALNVYPDDADNLEAIKNDLAPPNSKGKPQPFSPVIEDVVDSREQASQIRAVTGAIKIVLTAITALLLLASLGLVANTIRLSIYARRREVEVTRLVGATNWFIRWPFIIEGLVVGLFGAGCAVFILWLGKVTIVDPLSDRFALVAAQNTIEFLPLVGILIGAAMVVSALGSGITLRRFLQV
ncbi:MAG TPA: permease-like cell division protein FtsX [Solirubrobacterales bacterium]|nr:permease-like cell division protein FtsX [Solirubrobacterales bacterium]